jgi:hypothetical protein
MAIFSGPEIPNNGLVLHLDAANPRSYPGSGTTWTDLSGNGNNATLINGVGYSGNNKGTLAFDGVDDYCTVPSSPLWAVGQSATMENWMYFDRVSAGTNHRIWCITNNASSLDIGIAVSNNKLFVSGSTGFPETVSNFPTKQWVHLVVRFLNGNLSIFFNGISQALNGTTTGINKTNTGVLFLNQYAGGGGYTFQGQTASYALYNRALSDLEIQQNFEATRGRYGI